MPIGSPIGVIDHGVGHRIGGERLVAAPKCGNAMEHEDKVIEEAFDVVLDAGRGLVQLLASNSGDHGLGDLYGFLEEWSGIATGRAGGVG